MLTENNQMEFELIEDGPIRPRCLVALPLDIEEILKAFEAQGL